MSPSIWFLVTAIQAAAVIAVVSRGLFRPHAALVIYLGVSVGFWAYANGADLRSDQYRKNWGYILPLMTGLKIWVGIQAYGRSLELFPNARRLSHYVLLGLCAAAGLAAQFLQTTQSTVGVFSRVEQGVSLALGIFCLCMIALLNRFYSPRRRPNAIVHEWLLAIHYIGVAIWILATHWGAFAVAQLVFAGSSVVACAGWATCLTSAGEALPASPAATGQEASEKELAERQMAALAGEVKRVGASMRATKS